MNRTGFLIPDRQLTENTDTIFLVHSIIPVPQFYPRDPESTFSELVFAVRVYFITR